MNRYETRFDGRSAADWLLDAEHFERMADQLKGKTKLSRSFRELAAEARRKAAYTRLASARDGNRRLG